MRKPVNQFWFRFGQQEPVSVNKPVETGLVETGLEETGSGFKLVWGLFIVEPVTSVWNRFMTGHVVSKTDDRIDKLVDQNSNLVDIDNKQVVAPTKAVEKVCVTCGGAHDYYECIATDSNPSSICAATGSYNQVSLPSRASHQIPPPRFASVQNNPNRFNQNQGQGNYFNQGNNFKVNNF
nr:hypothetical protein [Tanacetum cinerariifolium]